jgi:hypothetical protein
MSFISFFVLILQHSPPFTGTFFHGHYVYFILNNYKSELWLTIPVLPSVENMFEFYLLVDEC